MKLIFQKRGCPQSNNKKDDGCHGGPLREQQLFKTMMIKMHQSQTTTVPLIMPQPVNAMACPDEDQQ